MAHSSLSPVCDRCLAAESNTCRAACRPRCAGYFPEVGKVSMSELASNTLNVALHVLQVTYACGCYSWICTTAILLVHPPPTPPPKKKKKKLGLCLEGWMCAHAGMGALGSASLLPVTRRPYSCDDVGSMHLCIFSLCEGCGCDLYFWVLVQVDLGSLAACSRLCSIGVGEGSQRDRREDCK